MKIKSRTIKITLLSILGVLILAGIVLALPKIASVAGYIINLFLPFIVAYFFALIVNPLITKLQTRFKIPRGASIFIVMVLLIGGLGGIITGVVIKIVEELRKLYTQFPEIYENMSAAIENIKLRLWGFYEVLPPNVQQSIETLGDDISARVAQFINNKSMPMMTSAGSFAKTLPSIVISFIIFLLASFFILGDFQRVKGVVTKPFSENAKTGFALLSSQIKSYLGGYVKAQGIIMSIAFVILFLGLTILNVEYALLIALGTAFLDALPFFGSGAVLWPWSIVSFINGNVKMGVGAIIIYVVLVITRQLIEPKIVSSKIGMHPLLTLMSMYIGYRTLSIGGMILGPIILMLIISFYKAGFFTKPIALIHHGRDFTRASLKKLRIKINNIWESE